VSPSNFHLLLTGSPDGSTPASFTRFVLPFAYQLQPSQAKDAEAHFKAVSPPDWLRAPGAAASIIDVDARKDYLTSETSRVLFERAKWFELSEERSTANTNQMANISSAGLILFEMDETEFHAEASLLHTGFLVFELSLPVGSTAQLSDLMIYNEIFRYWREPFSGHQEKDVTSACYRKVSDVLQAWPSQSGGGGDPYFSRWQEAFEHPVKLSGNRWATLMPEKWGESAENIALRNPIADSTGQPKPNWIVQPDNRAYVWTCAMYYDGTQNANPADLKPDAELTTMAKTFDGGPESIPSTDCTPWIKFLNVDLPSSASDTASRFEHDWVSSRTYRRWASQGTLYGFTNHSGAMLSGPCLNPPTWQHFRQIYFDQALLMLYVQTTIFRFSERLSALTATAASSQGDDAVLATLIAPFDKLRLDFTIFTNLYQFPLVSKQQQGLEMYVLLRQQMDVQDLFAEVQSEIVSTQEFLNAKEESRQANASEKLNFIALAGLVLSLSLACFGVADPFLKALGLNDMGGCGTIILFLVGLGVWGGIAFFGWGYLTKRQNKRRKE
jgi:hypothetical protein